MHKDIIASISNIRTSKNELFVQILFVFILPIFLINFGFISFEYRIPLLIILVTALLSIILIEKWGPKMLGFTKINFRKYILPYALFTIVGVWALTSLGEVVGNTGLSMWWNYNHFLYLFVLVSIFQEIAYRGYLIPALGKLTNEPLYMILVNATIFTLLHTIFPNVYINLPVAFIGGIGFALMYMRFPNLILIIISHSILNFFAVLYGFFVIPGVTY